jgi:hypothetical protein
MNFIRLHHVLQRMMRGGGSPPEISLSSAKSEISTLFEGTTFSFPDPDPLALLILYPHSAKFHLNSRIKKF